jgi:hypothetical protein
MWYQLNNKRFWGIARAIAIIVATLTVVFVGGTAGCVKRAQYVDGKQGQKVEAKEEQTGNYNDEADFEFKIADDGKSVMITKYVGEKLDVRIPSKLLGLPITGIGDMAFSKPPSVFSGMISWKRGQKRKITNVTIPNSVTTIGRFAFA